MCKLKIYIEYKFFENLRTNINISQYFHYNITSLISKNDELRKIYLVFKKKKKKM